MSNDNSPRRRVSLEETYDDSDDSRLDEGAVSVAVSMAAGLVVLAAGSLVASSALLGLAPITMFAALVATGGRR